MIQKAYLEALFSDTPGHLDVRAFSTRGEPPHVAMTESIDIAANTMQMEADNHRNVYVGVATRANDEARDKSNLLAVKALWVDVDYTESSGPEEFAQRLASLQKPPSMRVFSGGGEHVYWLLEEPFVFEGPSDVERFEFTLKGLAIVLEADRNATDASRILRVPGTVNYPDEKKRAAGRVETECGLMDIGDGSYSLDDFSEFELRGRSEKGPAQTEMPGSELPLVVRSYLQRDPQAMDRYMRRTTGLRDSSASGVDYALAARLARHAPVSQADAQSALYASRARASEDLKRPDYYERTVRAAFTSIRKGEKLIAFEEDSTEWFRRTMHSALDVAEQIKTQPITGGGGETLRYPTHLKALHEWQGGWYGVTTLAGGYGAGKSMLALSESLGAAVDPDPWTVAYFNCEMADNVVANRIQRYFNLPRDEILKKARNFNMFKVMPGCRLSHIIEWAEAVVQAETERLLIVIDSINTLATFAGYSAGYKENYFSALEHIVLWAQEVRDHSGGRISVILVSELNKDGDAKGGKVNYSSDCVLSIKDLSEDLPDTVAMFLRKSRERGIKDLGQWTRDFRVMRFAQEGDTDAWRSKGQIYN